MKDDKIQKLKDSRKYFQLPSIHVALVLQVYQFGLQWCWGVSCATITAGGGGGGGAGATSCLIGWGICCGVVVVLLSSSILVIFGVAGSDSTRSKRTTISSFSVCGNMSMATDLIGRKGVPFAFLDCVRQSLH